MLSILGAEWASNTSGNGSGSLQIDNFVKKPQELDSTNVKQMGSSVVAESSSQVHGAKD